MKLRIEKSVTVITPTIGSDKLLDAMESVSLQTYKNIKHLIVIDGHDYADKARAITQKYPQSHVMQLPYNTGGDGYYGHRIYAGLPHLVFSDYISFLDEDNWYKPNHIESLVNTIEENVIDGYGKKVDFEFAYSLRGIYSPNKTYLLDDNCESLGMWPIWFSHKTPQEPQHLIDTSSFLFKREFLVNTSYLWHHGWGGDRRYYNMVKRLPHNCSGEHTLCYRLDGNPNSVTAEFFEQGNKIQSEHYNGKLPWIRK